MSHPPVPSPPGRGDPSPRRTSRRAFLAAAAGLGGGLVLGACSTERHHPARPSRARATPATTSQPSAPSTTVLATDVGFAATAASLENLAVYAYRTVLKAFSDRRLPKPPPALGALVSTAEDHHTAHAAAWNGLLTQAGRRPISGTDPALTPEVNGMLAGATSALGAAAVALVVENVLAQTYQESLGTLTDPKALALAASVQPVEMGHAALLYFLLGRYPGLQGSPENAYAAGAPLSFSPTTLARPTGEYAGS